MTMQIDTVESGAVRTLKRTTIAGLVAVAIAILSVAIAINFSRDADVRHTFGPCLGNINTPACQLYREEVARSGSNESACIAYYRATGHVGAQCSRYEEERPQ